MNKITGNGCPSYDLEASVGQFYEDLDTGNVYECQSITNVADTVTYNWVLRAHGEHIDDHAEIFGGGSATVDVINDEDNGTFDCVHSFDEAVNLIRNGAVLRHVFVAYGGVINQFCCPASVNVYCEDGEANLIEWGELRGTFYEWRKGGSIKVTAPV